MTRCEHVNASLQHSLSKVSGDATVRPSSVARECRAVITETPASPFISASLQGLQVRHSSLSQLDRLHLLLFTAAGDEFLLYYSQCMNSFRQIDKDNL